MAARLLPPRPKPGGGRIRRLLVEEAAPPDQCIHPPVPRAPSCAGSLQAFGGGRSNAKARPGASTLAPGSRQLKIEAPDFVNLGDDSMHTPSTEGVDCGLTNGACVDMACTHSRIAQVLSGPVSPISAALNSLQPGPAHARDGEMREHLFEVSHSNREATPESF